MRLKSYFAATVESAMNLARQELGADAMLVSTKRTAEDTRAFGEYEVVFASTDHVGARANLIAAPPESGRTPSLTAQPINKLSEEVAGLKREMERLASALARSSAGMASMAVTPEIAEVFSKLVDAEVDAAIAQDIVSRVTSTPELANGSLPGHLTASVGSEIMQLLNVDSRMPVPGKNIIILVGPPGAGKTTTLVKLAVLYGLTGRKRCQLLSMDTHRVAASEQLRSYAAITGLGFEALETPLSLAQAVEEHRTKDLILVDTPGFARNEMEDAAEMGRVISKLPHAETHLVLSASMKTADIKRMVAMYDVFAPAKLIFTHLDETETFGSILNLSLRTGKPISFVTSGQQIPDDIAPADRRFLAGLVLGDALTTQHQLSSPAAA